MTLDSLSMLLFQWPVHIWNFHLIQESKWCPRKFWNLSKKHHYQHQLLWFLWILPYFIGFFYEKLKDFKFYDILWFFMSGSHSITTLWRPVYTLQYSHSIFLLQHSSGQCTTSDGRILSYHYRSNRCVYLYGWNGVGNSGIWQPFIHRLYRAEYATFLPAPRCPPPCPCPQVSMVTSPLVHVTRGFLENDFHKKNANSLL